MNNSLHSSIFKATLFVALAAALAACGGGDGDGDSPSAPSAIDKYVGTFATACSPDEGMTDASTGARLNSRILLVVQPKSSPTKAPAQLKVEAYTAVDCSGTALNTITAGGADTFFQVDGTATIGSDTVDKVTTSSGPFFPGITAATITVRGVTYDGSFYGQQTVDVEKDIYLLKGADLFAGDPDAPVDTTGYPTALQAVPAAKKQ
jgi:hypothetical protein